MPSIETIYNYTLNGVNQYINSIPGNTFEKATNIFLIRGAVAFIESNGDLTKTLSKALVSATASIVHGLITPFFIKLYSNSQDIGIIPECIRSQFSVISAVKLSKYFGENLDKKEYLSIVLTINSLLTFFKERRSTGSANEFFIL